MPKQHFNVYVCFPLQVTESTVSGRSREGEWHPQWIIKWWHQGWLCLQFSGLQILVSLRTPRSAVNASPEGRVEVPIVWLPFSPTNLGCSDFFDIEDPHQAHLEMCFPGDYHWVHQSCPICLFLLVLIFRFTHHRASGHMPKTDVRLIKLSSSIAFMFVPVNKSGKCQDSQLVLKSCAIKVAKSQKTPLNLKLSQGRQTPSSEAPSAFWTTVTNRALLNLLRQVCSLHGGS